MSDSQFSNRQIPKGWKRVLAAMMVMVGVIFLSLVVMEVGLRWAGPLYLRALLSEGSFLKMKKGEIILTPGKTTRLLSRTGEFEHEVKINHSGFRDDRELDEPKKQDEYRVAFLGDSFTFGYGSAFTDTIPYLLEQKWNAEAEGGHQVRTLNFGFRSGNCPRPQYVFFQNHLSEFQPDEVYWMHFLGNDLDEMAYFQVEEQDEFGLPKRLSTPMGALASLMKHFACWQMIRVPLKTWVVNWKQGQSVRIPAQDADAQPKALPHQMQLEEMVRMASVMQSESEKRKWRFHVVLISGPHSDAPLFIEQDWLKAAYLEKGIDTVDLSEMYGDLTTGEVAALFYPGDGHFTPKGNRFATAWIKSHTRIGSEVITSTNVSTSR